MDINRYVVLSAGLGEEEEFESELDASNHAARDSRIFSEEEYAYVVKRINPDGDEKVIEIWFDGKRYA